MTAFSPLGNGSGSYSKLGLHHSCLTDPAIMDIAARLQVAPAQVGDTWDWGGIFGGNFGQ